jgi:hypothetical protein
MEPAVEPARSDLMLPYAGTSDAVCFDWIRAAVSAMSQAMIAI